MNYELAKELKDAGFPQGIDFESIMPYAVAAEYALTHDANKKLAKKYEDSLDALKTFYSDDTKEYVRMPTLEELIEACGNEFIALTQKNGASWVAGALVYANPSTKKMKEILGRGDTPTDAVARLWLALNKKD